MGWEGESGDRQLEWGGNGRVGIDKEEWCGRGREWGWTGGVGWDGVGIGRRRELGGGREWG